MFELMLENKHRKYSIKWYYGLKDYQANYKVEVTLYNRLVYTKILDKKHYFIYYD